MSSLFRTGFLDLPDEIIESTLIYLRDDHTLRDFVMVATVCHRLHDIVTPMIYHTVWLFNSVAGEKFAKTIANHPALIPHVRELQIHNHGNYGYDDTKKPPFPCPEDLEHVIAQLFNLQSLAMRSDWFQNSADRRRALPCDLQRVINKWQNATLSWQLGVPAKPQVLPNLKTCNIGFDFIPEKGYIFSTMEPIFHHSGLESLSITNICFEQVGNSRCPSPLLTRSTNLKELVLLNCDVSPEGLRQILSLPHALRRFTMKGEIQFSEHGHEHTANRQDYMDALRTHADSLEFLDVDLYYTSGQGVDLRGFSVLRELTLSTNELTGDYHKRSGEVGAVLPPSLRRLVLRDEFGTFPLAAILVKVAHGQLPVLNTVACHTSPGSLEDEQYMEEDEEDEDEDDVIYNPDFPLSKKREKNMELYADAFKNREIGFSIDDKPDPLWAKNCCPCGCWDYRYRMK